MAQTRRDRVLEALAEAERVHRVTTPDGLVTCPDGWVTGYTLCHPGIGGSEGLRRLREVRALGHQIEKRAHPIYGRTSRQYRLVTPTTLFP